MSMVVVVVLVIVVCIGSVSSSKMIKRIAIVGAGPGGLGTAAALKRLGYSKSRISSNGDVVNGHVDTIDIYEARSSPSSSSTAAYYNSPLGGGIQLSGGAVTLGLLGLEADINRVALRLTDIVAVNDNDDTIYTVDVDSAVYAQNKDSVLCSSTTGGVQVYSIMRNALNDILFRATQTSSSDSSSGSSSSCLLYTSPSPRDRTRSRMPSSA